MDDKRGDIIQAIEQCLRRNGCSSCENCPYTHVGDGFECREKLRDDIIALLKAQKPVKPLDENCWDHTMGRCGYCKAPLPAIDGLRSKFCWMCGKAVKWE